MPLEVALSGIPHSVRVFSHTQFGLSMIILTFDDKADDYFARQQVPERLQGVELPEGVTPELEAMSSAVGEIYRYVLKGPHMTPTQLRTVQEWTMERSLRTVPGVADVISFGGFARTFRSSRTWTSCVTAASAWVSSPRRWRGQLECRRRLRGTRPAAVPDPWRGPDALAGRHRQRGGGATRGTPILVRDLAGIADTGLPGRAWSARTTTTMRCSAWC